MQSLNGSILPMSTILPERARRALVVASRVERNADHPPGECAARNAQVDAAVDFARAEFPTFFHEEK